MRDRVTISTCTLPQGGQGGHLHPLLNNLQLVGKMLDLPLLSNGSDGCSLTRPDRFRVEAGKSSRAQDLENAGQLMANDLALLAGLDEKTASVDSGGGLSLSPEAFSTIRCVREPRSSVTRSKVRILCVFPDTDWYVAAVSEMTLVAKSTN